MNEKERDTKLALSEEDEPVEWTDEMFDRAQISVGGVVIREATGTLTKRGRPPVGDVAKQQVTLRLPRHVLEHFKAGGAGWQSRLGEALEDYVSRKDGPRRASVAETQAPYGAGKPAPKRK
jgi:uncharacterized protein (DUF4415 family)